MNNGQPIPGGNPVTTNPIPPTNPSQQPQQLLYNQNNIISTFENQKQQQLYSSSNNNGIINQMSKGTEIPVTQQTTVPNTGDIILTSNTPNSHKFRKIVIAVSFVLLISIVLVISFYVINNQTKVFKSQVSEYNKQYQSLIESYTDIIDTQKHTIKWASIADVTNDSFASINTLSNSIIGSNPILIDSDSINQVKDIISETSNIARIVKNYLLYLKTIYKDYVSYWLPFINSKTYLGPLPSQEYLTNEFSVNDELFTIDDALRAFSIFMIAYQNSLYSLHIQFNEYSCIEDLSANNCQQIQNLMDEAHLTLLAEWSQIEDDIYSSVNTIKLFSINDLYGIAKLNDLERELNE